MFIAGCLGMILVITLLQIDKTGNGACVAMINSEARPILLNVCNLKSAAFSKPIIEHENTIPMMKKRIGYVPKLNMLKSI